MITEDKVTEIFSMIDDFCQFFDAMTAKYTLKSFIGWEYRRGEPACSPLRYFTFSNSGQVPLEWHPYPYFAL